MKKRILFDELYGKEEEEAQGQTIRRAHGNSFWLMQSLHGLGGTKNYIFRCPFCGALAEADFLECPACARKMWQTREGKDGGKG